MSLDISFESACSAIAYAEDAIPRFLRTGSVSFTRDADALRRRVKRRMLESLPDVGPSPQLARYALKMEREGQSHRETAIRWGCALDTVLSALAMFPGGKERDEPEQQMEQASLFPSQCEHASGSLS